MIAREDVETWCRRLDFAEITSLENGDADGDGEASNPFAWRLKL